jgi:hypothetical protein
MLTGVVMWVIAASSSLFVGLVVARRLRLRVVPGLVLGVLVSAAGAASLFIATRGRSGSVDIRIAEPLNGAQIEGCRVQVRGSVSPSNVRVGIAVRSETDDKWWIQPYVLPTEGGDTATWSVEVFLGTATEGINENFQLVALASADPVIVDALNFRHLWTRRHLDDLPATGCPENFGTEVLGLPPLPKSTPTIVRRAGR